MSKRLHFSRWGRVVCFLLGHQPWDSFAQKTWCYYCGKDLEAGRP